MNTCYIHNQEEAVSTCSSCGVGLCHECDTKYEIPICDSCQQKSVRNDRIKFVLGIGMGLFMIFATNNIIDEMWRGETIPLFLGKLAMFLFGFSISQGLEDFKLAWNNEIMQKLRVSIKQQGANATARGESSLVTVLAGYFFMLCIYPFIIGFYGGSSFFRAIKRLIKR
ncbi:hypothetical protein N5T98_03080 [Aliarcobacter cryaerophilus]|uniref:hypothetical protein n=1 Tax=Aliarcobacter cryaerophilus TaxID=28198 RepID=UPI0021B6C108|nr:hypothetical protein [Aliarcobacter cryaerophilus]MCT7485767.1 hypothetical protein [Aliarcobacter cryaerophilus]MCT7490075.1 hypothetical protein [Aliarcobacter cryaerophilus]